MQNDLVLRFNNYRFPFMFCKRVDSLTGLGGSSVFPFLGFNTLKFGI